MIINLWRSSLFTVAVCCGFLGCKPSLTALQGAVGVEFYPRQFADTVQVYEVCCGSTRGFLLDTATINALDIWTNNRYGEFFTPLVLPLAGKEYVDIATDCQAFVKFDPKEKRITFQFPDRRKKYIQFDKNLRDLAFGLLANERKEKLIIAMEIGGALDSKSKLYLLTHFKEQIECN
ncbi:MAG: hypothetical protein IGR93_12895 [Hydrococcus sp. C42_A2020_068]|nr:hypothetical protein [Hydrococcus sp. C42_A2020_068]